MSQQSDTREPAIDIRAFLAQNGVQVSESRSAQIAAALRAKAAGSQQAAIIHLDG